MISNDVKALYADDIRLLRKGDESVKTTSDRLSLLQAAFDSVLSVVQNQFVLDRFQHKEDNRIAREISSEGPQLDPADILNSQLGGAASIFALLAEKLLKFGTSLSRVSGGSLGESTGGPKVNQSGGSSVLGSIGSFIGGVVGIGATIAAGSYVYNKVFGGTTDPSDVAVSPTNKSESTTTSSSTPEVKGPTVQEHKKPSAITTAISRTMGAVIASNPIAAAVVGGAARMSESISGGGSAVEESIETDSVAGGNYGSILDLIAQGEGNYNSVNSGVAGNMPGGAKKYFGKDLTDMSVGEVMQLQAQKKIFAAGRYQIIPETMKTAVNKSGVKMTDRFNQATQDRLGTALIKNRPRLNAYVTGKSNDIVGAMDDMSREWASIPNPHTGRSYYDKGPGRNSAKVSGSAVRSALESTRAVNTGGFIKPVGGRISSKFGRRSAPKAGASKDHKGIDIAAGMGSPVAAAKDGTIIRAGWAKGYGQLIEVSHGNGLTSRYAHLSQIAVSVGQQVKGGQQIGNVGSSGVSTGPHLHFEIRQGGNPVNPEPYIGGSKATETDPTRAAAATEPDVTPTALPKKPQPKISSPVPFWAVPQNNTGKNIDTVSQEVRVRRTVAKNGRVVYVPITSSGAPSVVVNGGTRRSGSPKPISSAGRYKGHFN